MKKLGLLCGLGPETTLLYYKNIIDAFKESYNETGYPEIILESYNLKKLMQLAEDDDWNTISSEFSQIFERMKQNGAEIGAIASNTPHLVFDSINSGTDLNLISIVESVKNEVIKLDYKNVCIMGSSFTLNSNFYGKEFSKYGIKTSIPNSFEIEYIEEKLDTEIEHGIILEETKKGFINIVDRIVREEGADSVIMACTELPLILKETDFQIPYINSVTVHTEAIVKFIKNSH